jgi:hypothetical protein
MSQRPPALKRRIAPSTPFTLRCTDAEGKDVEQKLLLCFDADALCALEEKVPSLNTLQLGGLAIFGRMNARVLVAALWAAALRHQPEFDTVDGNGASTDDGLEAIGSFVDSGNAPDVVKALEGAYLATLPKERADEIRKMTEAGKGSEENPTKAVAAPAAEETMAGSNSGASAATTSA